MEPSPSLATVTCRMRSTAGGGPAPRSNGLRGAEAVTPSKAGALPREPSPGQWSPVAIGVSNETRGARSVFTHAEM